MRKTALLAAVAILWVTLVFRFVVVLPAALLYLLLVGRPFLL